ncbi:uncharacterized protein LOC127242378 [Andrographis paniculata]|uniref:uncharacterized protein LOC127242378 n=1 Tax=Andrographis paniculata TaxID=175694 RepID=UPI0021E98637|nr:uncharacterized protein LOC127242378 [Andrographis paniculata]
MTAPAEVRTPASAKLDKTFIDEDEDEYEKRFREEQAHMVTLQFRRYLERKKAEQLEYEAARQFVFLSVKWKNLLLSTFGIWTNDILHSLFISLSVNCYYCEVTALQGKLALFKVFEADLSIHYFPTSGIRAVFSKLLSEDVSDTVEFAWSHPMKTIQDENGVTTLVKKPKREWTLNEKAAGIANSKALFSIFNAVDETQGKLISNCKTTKEAWDILENAFKGSVQVRESKLDPIETLFEGMKMNEDETIDVYNNRFMDVFNQAEAPGMHFEEKRLVRKMLKSLTKNFRPKLIMLDEPPKLKNMTLDELYGTLVNYEMNYLEDETPKSVALSAEDMEVIESDEEMALLSRKLSRMISDKRLAKLKYGRFPNKSGYHDGNAYGSQQKYSDQKPTSYNKPKGKFEGGFNKKFKVSSKPNTIQEPTCYGCGGVGHIKSECPTVKKREKRAYQAIWSDNDEEGSAAGEETSENDELVAFMAGVDESSKVDDDKSNSENSEESRELDADELIEAYEEMVSEQKKSLVKYKKLLNTIYRLQDQKEKLDDEIEQLKNDTEAKSTESDGLKVENQKLKEENDRLRKGKEKLDEVLSIGKPFGDHKGIGFCESSQRKPTTFVRCGLLTDVEVPENKYAPVKKQKSRKNRSRNWNTGRRTQDVKPLSLCPDDYKYCILPGHTAEKCFRLAKDVMNGRNIEWPTEGLRHNIKVRLWMLLSHDKPKKLLKNFVEDKSGDVIFEDGAKGKISGYGILEKEIIPRLSKVYFVEGLSTNLISISQLCDDKLNVKFTRESCEVFDADEKCVMIGVRSKNNCYLLEKPKMQALILKDDETMLWHTKLGHFNPQNLMRISKLGAIRGLSKFSKLPRATCGHCARGKQKRVAHLALEQQTSNNCLELLHLDLMGPVDVYSLGGNKYILKKVKINRLQTDHGKEFENKKFSGFYDKLGIKHEYSAPKTPQPNGVVERKNRTLQEMARSIMHAKGVAKFLWAEAINTACYVINHVYLRPHTEKTPYEIWSGKKPNVSYFHTFGCRCYIMKDQVQLHKFDACSDDGIFLGYSLNSRAYRVYNNRTKKVMESVNVMFDDALSEKKYIQLDDDDDAPNPVISSPPEVQNPPQNQNDQPQTAADDATEKVRRYGSRIPQKHPIDAIIGDPKGGRVTRGKQIDFKNLSGMNCFVSTFEPRNIDEALKDEYWLSAMQDELNQFERNGVWMLVQRLGDCNVIGTKWIFKKKSDECGNITRNKARLVSQGYTQIEESTMTKPLPWLPVSKLDKTLFIKRKGKELMFSQIYVDDIVFGSTSKLMRKEFVKFMDSEFKMSMIGELTYFLGLQVKQCVDGIFLNQTKYAQNMINKFGLSSSKAVRMPLGQQEKLSTDESRKDVDQKLYRSIIGSLLYLTASRPDILFSVGVYARFQAAPKESYLKAAKRIIHYVHGTAELGLWLEYVETKDQKADILTKALDGDRFETLRRDLGMCSYPS